MEIDLAYTNYGLPDDVWRQLQEMNEKHLEAHPVCELCGRRPSVRITPVGPIQASCNECVRNIRDAIEADIQASLEEREDWE